MTPKPVSRLDFLQYASLNGTAFLLGLSRSTAVPGMDSLETGSAKLATGVGVNTLSFKPHIHIDPTGGITIFITKPEMGQGRFQSIPALICEELGVTMDQVTIKQSNGEKKLAPVSGRGQRVNPDRVYRTTDRRGCGPRYAHSGREYPLGR